MAVWPAATVWLIGWPVTEGVTDTPAPVIGIVSVWVVTTGAIGVLKVLAGGVED